MASRIAGVLNKLRGSSLSSSDELALQQVVETFFFDDDKNDTPIGKYTHDNNEYLCKLDYSSLIPPFLFFIAASAFSLTLYRPNDAVRRH